LSPLRKAIAVASLSRSITTIFCCRIALSTNSFSAIARAALYKVGCNQRFLPGGLYALATLEAFSATDLNSAPVQALTLLTWETAPVAAAAISAAMISSCATITGRRSLTFIMRMSRDGARRPSCSAKMRREGSRRIPPSSTF
jgi:hypothetical protein